MVLLLLPRLALPRVLLPFFPFFFTQASCFRLPFVHSCSFRRHQEDIFGLEWEVGYQVCCFAARQWQMASVVGLLWPALCYLSLLSRQRVSEKLT